MGITQSDIAKAANVSRSAVALALNGIGRQNVQTRDRICQMAKDMGYRPNMLVKGMKTGKTRSIGVLMDCGDGFFGRVCGGIQHYLSQNGYVPIIVSNLKETGEVDLIHSLLDRRVDGCIFRPSSPELMSSSDNVYVSEISSRNIPMVAVDNQFHEMDFADFCGTDDVQGGRLAAEHLISLGHRNLAYLFADDENDRSQTNSTALRRKGFKAVIDENQGVTFTEIDVLENNCPLESSMKMLRSSIQPTGVLVSNDHYVVDLYRSAEKLGLKIPEDISVVGFGDHDFTKYISPSLTTINEHPYKIGLAAAKLLLGRIDETITDDEHLIIRQQPELVVRGSTAACDGQPQMLP